VFNVDWERVWFMRVVEINGQNDSQPENFQARLDLNLKTDAPSTDLQALEACSGIIFILVGD